MSLSSSILLTCQEHLGKQVRDSSLKVVFRPKQTLRPQEEPQTAQVIWLLLCFFTWCV